METAISTPQEFLFHLTEAHMTMNESITAWWDAPEAEPHLSPQNFFIKYEFLPSLLQILHPEAQEYNPYHHAGNVEYYLYSVHPHSGSYVFQYKEITRELYNVFTPQDRWMWQLQLGFIQRRFTSKSSVPWKFLDNGENIFLSLSETQYQIPRIFEQLPTPLQEQVLQQLNFYFGIPPRQDRFEEQASEGKFASFFQRFPYMFERFQSLVQSGSEVAGQFWWTIVDKGYTPSWKMTLQPVMNHAQLALYKFFPQAGIYLGQPGKEEWTLDKLWIPTLELRFLYSND